MDTGWDEKAVFLAALELPLDERPAFLQRACPNDEARARIEELLRHHEAVTRELLGAAVPPPDPTPAPLPTRIAEFNILRRLGEGGMGVVYLAEDTKLRRRVALKVISAGLMGSTETLERFHEEARTAAAIRHPAIVPIYNLGFDGQVHFIVSEFVDGPTLAQVIEQERTRRAADDSADTFRAWCRYGAQIVATIASGLDTAHRGQIVHRDVKPSNILIDKELGPRLTDFGIAKHLGEAGKEHTGVIGTCHYMSPEQAAIRGSSVDQRSDIFSLGVVLYELLTLRRPFEGATLQEVLRAVIERQPAHLRSLDRRIPRDLQVICHKAIEKQPRDRYQSAAHVEADLRSFLAGDPILAAPPSLRRRLARWTWRQRRILGVASLALLVFGLAATSCIIREQHDATLAWITIDTGRAPCRAWLQGHDPRTLRPDAERGALGRTAPRLLKLKPGHYRLTLERVSDGAFCEFNLTSLAAGRPRAARLRVVDAADAAGQRTASGELLGVFRSTADVEADGMIAVAGGKYALQRAPDDAFLLRGEIELDPFLIDATEVSNAEYREFVEATGHAAPHGWTLVDDWGQIADLPVFWVSLPDAEAFARWRGKRLPTFWEWQVAARGPEARRFPNGDTSPGPASAPAYAASGASTEEIIRNYRLHARPTTSPAPWDTPGGVLHTFSNLKEFCATLGRNGEAYLLGRDWRNPTTLDLSYHETTTPHHPLIMAGFRCAKSKLSIGKEP